MLRKFLFLSILSVLLATFVAAGEFKEWCGENIGPAPDREGEVSKRAAVDFLWILEMDTRALVYVNIGRQDDQSTRYQAQSFVSWLASKRDNENIVFNAVDKESEEMRFRLDDLSTCDQSRTTEFMHFKETINLIKNPKVHQCLEDRPFDRKCIEFFRDQFDVYGEGRVFSKAELSRLIRTVGIISTYFQMVSESTTISDEIPFEDLEQNQLLLFTYSDAFAGFLINSMDYNADGKLSMDEILHDRTLDDWVDAIHSGKLASTFILGNIHSSLVEITKSSVESAIRPRR